MRAAVTWKVGSGFASCKIDEDIKKNEEKAAEKPEDLQKLAAAAIQEMCQQAPTD